MIFALTLSGMLLIILMYTVPVIVGLLILRYIIKMVMNERGKRSGQLRD